MPERNKYTYQLPITRKPKHPKATHVILSEARWMDAFLAGKLRFKEPGILYVSRSREFEHLRQSRRAGCCPGEGSVGHVHFLISCKKARASHTCPPMQSRFRSPRDPVSIDRQHDRESKPTSTLDVLLVQDQIRRRHEEVSLDCQTALLAMDVSARQIVV